MVTIVEKEFISQKDGVGIYRCEFKEPVTLYAVFMFLQHATTKGKLEVQNPPKGCSIKVCEYGNGEVLTTSGYDRFVNARVSLHTRESSTEFVNYIIAFDNYDVV